MADVNNIEQPLELSDNFIVSLYQVSGKMEDNAHSFVRGADQREKDLEETWKITNKKKADLQRHELAQISKNMAYVSSVLLVVSVAASVGGTALAMGAHANTGKLIGDLGNLVSNQGNTVAQHVSGIYSQTTNSLVEELTQRSQKTWEGDKRDNETRKTELNELKSKINNGTQAAMEKAAMAYSYRG